MARVGVVLGAGGVTGDAFHRGVLRALRERGYDARAADVVVGTSAGSMVAADLRKPEHPVRARRDETVHARKLGRTPDLSALLATLRRPWRARAGVIAASLLPTGRASTEFIAATARRYYGARWPDDPLYICAVRRRDGQRVVFGHSDAPVTDVPRAVAASCAIPGYFHPVEVNGEVYVDGGVHSPTNADVLRHEPLDVVLVSSPMSVDVSSARPTLDVGVRAVMHGYLLRETASLRRAGARVLMFEPGGSLLSVMGLNPLAAMRVDEIEEASAARAADVLEANRDVLDVLRRSSHVRSRRSA